MNNSRSDLRSHSELRASATSLVTLALVATMAAATGCSGPLEAVAPPVDLFSGDGPAEKALAEELAFDIVAHHPRLVSGITEFAVQRTAVDRIGNAHTRLQQTVDGVPVFGGEAIVHQRADGVLASVTDGVVPDVQVDTHPLYTGDEATEIAVAQHGGWASVGDVTAPELFVLRHEGADHLVWRIQVDLTQTATPSMPVVFVDAHSNAVVWSYENLKTTALNDADKRTYDMNNGTRYSRAVTGDSSDAELLMTHTAVGDVLDYFNTMHGRDSYNGAGAQVRSYGHYSRSYVNAFWDGSRLTFGDGDGYYSTYLGVPDVTFHEFSHGVTDYEANLTYAYESGALNEATSDIFAAAAEAYVDGGVTSDTWDIGEDCWIEPGTTALRYMSAPSDDGYSYDYYPARYTGSSDSGGVHWNSGIGNYFFYLLSQGGQHHTSAYQSGYTVTGVGIETAADIWYEALANYMTSSTNFSGARTATESACAALGYSTATCDSVSYAWYEVGVGSDPAGGGGGGGGGGTTCPGTSYSGSLSGTGASAIEPGGTYAYYSGGLSADLTGPSGTDFDLYLYRYSSGRWRLEDSSTSSSSTESVSSTRSAYFYMAVNSYSGSGAYDLCVQ